MPRKQTPADRRGGRTKRQPRDPGPNRVIKNPTEDLYGNGDEAVDHDLDLGKDLGKNESPNSRRE